KTMDYFILAAAVADFQVEQYSIDKIKKKDMPAEIKLKPTIDIANFLGEYKTEKQKMVGFALETNDVQENARLKLDKKNMNMIVINSPLEEGSAFGFETNRIDILKRNGEYLSFELKTKKELAVNIIDEMLKL
ncbi:MAG: phosphopantothenoylcysteine decarboxylase, partial [Saprospiraceae bacterium]